MFKNLFKKMSNIEGLEFEDARERAIYNAGKDFGRREEVAESLLKDAVIGLGSFIIIKAMGYYIRKRLEKDGVELFLEEYMEDED